MVETGNSTIITMRIWVEIMLETQTKTLIHIKIKVWTTIEEVSNNNKIKIIATNRTTIVISNRNLTNSRVEKFMSTTLKLIGMRIQMLGLTQLLRLSNRSFLSLTKKISSHKPRIHKIIITTLRIITTSNNEIGMILLTTKECLNINSSKDLILNNIGNNT